MPEQLGPGRGFAGTYVLRHPGEDKPLKYPTLIHTADLVVLSKMDIAEAVGFNQETAKQNIQAARPDIEMLEVSAGSGQGMEPWVESLKRKLEQKRQIPSGMRATKEVACVG